jgi:hypothetical protein
MRRPVPSTQDGTPRKRGSSLLRCCVLSTAYWVLVGCAAANRPTTEPDPLLGAAPARPAAPASSTPPAASLAAPAPLPAPASSTSTAALAPGAFTPLDPNHDLRIGGDARPPATPTGGGAWRGQSGPPDVTLRQPEATSTGAPPTRPVLPVSMPSSAAPGAGANVTTFEQAQALLRAHGVVWQRLETLGEAGEWKFSCAVPNRQNPNLRQNYEARAADQIAALRAVLDKIDTDQP